MKRSLLTFTLVATTMFSTVLVSPAMSQEPPQPSMARPEQNGPALPPPHDVGQRPERPDFHPGGPDRQFADLFLASKLSGAEIYIGITPEQLGAWRTYTTALLDLVGTKPPEKDGRPPAPKPAPNSAPAAMSPAAPPAGPGKKGDERQTIFGEKFADRLIEKAESANALKAAVEALKTTLTPDQLQKLAELEGAFMPPPPRADQGPRSERPRG